MMKKLLLYLVVMGFIFGCDPYENPLGDRYSDREILVYSGITMSDAVFELKELFEEENDCRVTVMYGASGYLKRVVEVNRVGDIFFPGNKSYVDEMAESNIVIRSEPIGFNRLSFFVQKDNPMLINGSLDQLKDNRYKVVIGADEVGAVGRETAKLLKAHGIYDDAVRNVTYFTPDSKGLTSALREGRADIVLNWYATGFFKKNKEQVESVEIDSRHIRRVPIVMGILKYSMQRECAGRFMNLAVSERGQEIFKNYGFR